MIYIITSECHAIAIIDDTNISELLAGRPMHTPDGMLQVAYTPDISAIMDRLKVIMANQDGHALDELNALLKSTIKAN